MFIVTDFLWGAKIGWGGQRIGEGADFSQKWVHDKL
jgi:hypothetical protein